MHAKKLSTDGHICIDINEITDQISSIQDLLPSFLIRENLNGYAYQLFLDAIIVVHQLVLSPPESGSSTL